MTAFAQSTYVYLTKRQAGLFIVLALIIALLLLGAVVSDRFRTPANLMNVFEQSTALALVSLGQSFAILTGGIDLSVGSMISLASVLLSGISRGDPAFTAFAICVVMALGIAVGLINGLAVIWLRVHPLIVTLGMGAALQGATLLYTLGPAGSMPLGFDYLAYGRLFGMPVGALITIVLFVAAAAFLRHTVFGRHIYAVGDDATAAELMGLPRRTVLLFVYAFSGFMAALAAIFLVARFGVGQPYTGQNFTLASITPVVVGGTMLRGGRGGVIGTLLGVYLISLLNNVMNFMDISSHFQLIVQGLIVMLAVSIYIESKRKI
jgi:ribose/xylose/arabinose/galactoside ABC-type transport system permease subunit